MAASSPGVSTLEMRPSSAYLAPTRCGALVASSLTWRRVPDEVLAAEQRLIRMKETLDRVSRRTREVFFMHRLQGLSHAEIAENLGVTISAVEKHVASALTILTIERQRE